ncbi:MAG: [FeFe] hydrogenase H-cluster radical SAM maturase HydG [Pseudomonadota bacterium]
MIHSSLISQSIDNALPEDVLQVREILSKAYELQGLTLSDVAALMNVKRPELLNELFHAASDIKEKIYGDRLVLFAPLYVSNMCVNECVYCAFRKENKLLRRCTLTKDQLIQDVKALIDQGHKRLLLVAGEGVTLSTLLEAIETTYATKNDHGEIRRINVNVAPLTLDEFKQLKAAKIGTYQLFQETYHRETYKQVHTHGPKSDYDGRMTAIDRAMQAGIDDVGIGALLGLYDWRFELLALLQHAKYLEKTFGVGPHTISVPRLEPALGMTYVSKHRVSDQDFLKLVAILRLAVPYTGIILSTRESPRIRRQALALGVSQISAGSRTNPGGYTDDDGQANQFELGDHRSLDEVIYDVISMGYLPSFCTSCYRLGRTGEHFMELAKPGAIKEKCSPNALLTFQEYLNDYASAKTRQLGELLIQQKLQQMSSSKRQMIQSLLDRVKQCERDIYI